MTRGCFFDILKDMPAKRVIMLRILVWNFEIFDKNADTGNEECNVKKKREFSKVAFDWFLYHLADWL